MPEATMLVLDNSEYMRNGDFIPTRWGAQTDATTIIFDAKTQSNPENMVGVMTMAGKSPRVLSTFSTDIGKLLQSLHSSQISGDSDVWTGINIAQLALKHRQNKVHTQRIIVFVGSPVKSTADDLSALGKRLKKNNVALDIVNFGGDGENEVKLRKLVDSASSGENSHLVTVSPGTALLSDILISSSILQGGTGSSAGHPGNSSGHSFEFGVDPGMDPELAMALRMSLEEEQARQRDSETLNASAAAHDALPRQANATSSSGGRTTESSTSSTLTRALSTAAPTSRSAFPSGGSLLPSRTHAWGGTPSQDGVDSEDALLKQALDVSQDRMGEDAEMSGVEHPVQGESVDGSGKDVKPAAAPLSVEEEKDEMTEEEAIARAIEMSLQGDKSAQEKR